MSLSLKQIRELNKVTLYVTCCTDPAEQAGSIGGDVWSQSLYSSGGFPLHGSIDVSDGKWLSNNLDSKGKGGWGSTFMSMVGTVTGFGFGMVPQLDYIRKRTFQQSSPLKFTLQCYLCLENSLEDDLLKPLSRLFFLTYPVRTEGLGGKAVDFFSKVGVLGLNGLEGLTENEEGGASEVILSLNEVFGTDVGAQLRGWVGSARRYLEGGDFRGDFLDTFGEVYGLRCPPTFRSIFSGGGVELLGMFGFDIGNTVDYGGHEVRYIRSPGSGLTVGYGGSIVNNCVITDLDVKIPKLYYHGGYPSVIEVGVTFETLRVGSADLYRDIVYGEVGSN